MKNQKYQTYEAVKDENYKGKFTFPMKDSAESVKYQESMFSMSNIFLKITFMASVCHNLNLINFVTQLILHIKSGEMVLWCELYVVGEPIVGTTRV